MATETPAAAEPTGPVPVNGTAPKGTTSNGTVTVFRLAAGFTFLAVAMGAVVCATGSGFACSTWPGCRPGAVAPHWEVSPVIEFTHRLVAISSAPLLLAAGLLSLRLAHRDVWVRVLPWLALAGAAVAGAFGRLVVLSGVSTWQAAIDVTCALTAMTVMGIAAVRIAPPSPVEVMSADDDAAVPVSRRQAVRPVQLAGAGVVVLIAMQIAGLFTAGKGSFTACMGWPLLQLVDGDRYPWLQVTRLVLAGVAAVLVVGTALLCAQHERLRPWAYVLVGLLVAELALGLVIGDGGASGGLRSVYSVIAVLLLEGLGLLTAVARVRRLVAAPAAPAESITV